MLKDVLFVEFNERSHTTDKAHCDGCDVIESSVHVHCEGCEPAKLTAHAHCEGCDVL